MLQQEILNVLPRKKALIVELIASPPNIPGRGEKVSHGHVHAKSFQLSQLFATLWTVACQAPLSMGLSRPESWSGVPFPSLGDLPNPGIELVSPVLTVMFFTISTTWEASHVHFYSVTVFQFHNRNVWLFLLLWNRLTGLFL